MDTLICEFICYLQGYSSEFLSVITLIFCGCVILFLLRNYGASGLYVYNSMAIILANIQVLRVSEFSFSPEPVALGTVVFATTFLVSDILTEHFGPQTARNALWLSFISQIFVVISMVLCLGHPPIHEGQNPDLIDYNYNYLSMFRLFSPSFRILCASLFAYILSQFFDIWVFQKIKIATNDRYIWLRQNVSVFLSGLLDAFIFNALAWVIFSPIPITWSTLIFSFVLGTYILRLIINILSTPFMYLSYRFSNK